MSEEASTQTGAASTLYLILIQVVSRGLTFVGNQALLRHVSPADLGLAVQFEALSISILYTARESLRVALQRDPTIASSTKAGNARTSNNQAAVNASSLVVALGLFIGCAVSTIYLQSAGLPLTNADNFYRIFSLYAAATFLELLSESSFVVIQQNAMFKERALAETAAAIMRCIGSVSGALYLRHRGTPTSALPFAVGQLCYSITLLLIHVTNAGRIARAYDFSLWPRTIPGTEVVLSLVPRKMLRLAGAFYGQSIFKWMLTQGDTLFLSYFADLQSQGIFALASNYGGLASRLLFQPIEESSRIQFGTLLAADNDAGAADGKPVVRASVMKRRQEALTQLAKTIKGYVILIVIPCTTFLPLIFPVLVSVLLGTRSTFNTKRTSKLLSAYSFYLPVLAINGVLDAFVTSIATEAELAEQSVAMVGVTVLYLSSAVGFMNNLGLAETGLVYANILNMLLRICFSIWYIRTWTKEKIPAMGGQAFTRFRSDCIPNMSTLLVWTIMQIFLQLRTRVKQHMETVAGFDRYSTLLIPGTDLDLFDVSYILSAALVLISSLVLCEQDYLLATLRKVVPSRFQSRLSKYMQLEAKDSKSK